MSDSNQIEASCDLCDEMDSAGNGDWSVSVLPHYNLTVCKACYRGSYDGFGPVAEPSFVAHMRKHNLNLPPRNENGWYPRDHNPEHGT